jgi:hypothetical protein
VANEQAWEDAESKLEKARVLEVAKMFWRHGFTKEATELLKMVKPKPSASEMRSATAKSRKRILPVVGKILTDE